MATFDWRSPDAWLQPGPFLLVGYFITVAIEAPVLLVGLSPRYSWDQKLFAGFWLTACTYPIVVWTLPHLLEPYGRGVFLAVAETFAPAAECVLFYWAYGRKPGAAHPSPKSALFRDFAAVIVANLLSFGAGELFYAWRAVG